LAAKQGKVNLLGAAPHLAAETSGTLIARMMLGKSNPGVHIHTKVEQNVYGVEDDKIGGAVKRATTQALERQKRDYAMHTATNNPVGQ
jgi:hypothetical protein